MTFKTVEFGENARLGSANYQSPLSERESFGFGVSMAASDSAPTALPVDNSARAGSISQAGP